MRIKNTLFGLTLLLAVSISAWSMEENTGAPADSTCKMDAQVEDNEGQPTEVHTSAWGT